MRCREKMGEHMVDLVIRGDTVVTPQGVGAHDILIAGGTIAAVAAPGSIPVPEGARVIDARGKIVIPGGIDPHVHCKWFLPNPDGSASETQPPDVVSKAAVHGGTTTMIDFTRTSQGKDVRDAIEKREMDWKGHCACDYAQHLMVEGAAGVALAGMLKCTQAYRGRKVAVVLCGRNIGPQAFVTVIGGRGEDRRAP